MSLRIELPDCSVKYVTVSCKVDTQLKPHLQTEGLGWSVPGAHKRREREAAVRTAIVKHVLLYTICTVSSTIHALNTFVHMMYLIYIDIYTAIMLYLRYPRVPQLMWL